LSPADQMASEIAPKRIAPARGAGKDSVPPLSEWLGVFAPAYRGRMAALIALNVLSAVTVFIELQLLRALTVVLSRVPSPADLSCNVDDWIRSGFSLEPEPCGTNLPSFLLCAYFVSVLAQSGVDLAAFAVSSRLTQRARHDVERELLRNLLRQDDGFYVRRSPSEIISRLGGDLHRVGGRRQIVTQAFATALATIAVAAVLILQSWVAAAIGLAMSVVGVLVAQPTIRKLRDLDHLAITADEQVKAAFEDTLQGVAEIQVSGLLPRVLENFAQRQRVRDRVALSNADLNNQSTVLQRLTFAIAFIAVLAAFVFTSLFRGSGTEANEGAATAGLIVVLIATLPQLYFRFGELTQLWTQFQIADVSALRLKQYEAPPPPPTRPEAETEGTIVLRDVRYQFSGSQTVRGGPGGLTCTIPAQGLTGVVGPAGAGKSTLIRLILGRQNLLDGSIECPGSGPDGSPFVYLPQRPVLFDARLRDNLFLGQAETGAAALRPIADRLGRLGVLDLIRLKGLDASPSETADDVPDLLDIRRGFREVVAAVLGVPLLPLGAGHTAPRQMAIENQLGCAVDQAALAACLISQPGREPVRALAAMTYGREMAPHAVALIRQTAPLLAQTSSPDEYNLVAAVKLDPGIWQLRAAALDMVMGGPDVPADGQPHPLLVAVALSARLEELEDSAIPAADEAARVQLTILAAGISRPLRADRLNPLLTWRENLLFATPETANTRRSEQLDRVLLEHLAGVPLDAAVIEAGLDFPVGRQGARMSGGQQQLVALSRALLSRAPVLVLDEPSSAFHPRLRLDLIAVLQEEARARSVIVVTHDMDMARGCDQLLFMRDGALAGQGSWAELAAGNEAFRSWIDELPGAPK
jgi:ABC-type multidrug transport system fused ATPase/permease subunit